MRRSLRLFGVAVAIAAAVPAIARAQGSRDMPSTTTDRAGWFVSPLIGASFGGDAAHASGTMGVAAGWIGSHWLSFEAELADSPYLVPQTGFLTSRRVTTFMGNAMVTIPHGTMAVTPYAVGGLGLLRPRFAEAGDFAVVGGHRLGMNVGGGIVSWVNEHLGARGEVRYFHGLRKSDTDGTNGLGIDVSSFGFWRLSGGIVARF